MDALVDRRASITRFAPRDRAGIEIAPWMNPLVAKADGYQSLTLDIFDRPRLVRNAVAAGLGHLVDRIEEVDIVCDAAEIGGLADGPAHFAYVVSSHNFEHLPNPIKFLRGCGAVLVDGGHLSMAIPDKRCCFDYFRPVSTTADMLAAWFEHRTRPSPAQVFAHMSLEAAFVRDGQHRYGFTLEDDLCGTLHPARRLESGFAAWTDALLRPDGAYHDAHCWAFTPASFELILRDLRHLGLIDLAVVDVLSAESEFVTHLRCERPAALPDAEAFYRRRARLLRQMMREAATNVPTEP